MTGIRVWNPNSGDGSAWRIENNWSWGNGYDLNGNHVGDGNGFKLGGGDAGGGVRRPYCHGQRRVEQPTRTASTRAKPPGR